jgi:excisionase family DNA binding protein
MAVELEAGKLSYTVNEAAAVVGVSRSTMFNKISKGEVASFTWAGRRLVHRDDLAKLIDDARAAPTARASLRPTPVRPPAPVKRPSKSRPRPA